MLPGLPRPKRTPPTPTGTIRDGVIDDVTRPLPTPTGWRVDSGPVRLPTPPTSPITRIQRALMAEAAIAVRYPGLRATGVLDGVTRAALAEFQHEAGLIVTGAIDRGTEIALGVVEGIPGLPLPTPPAPKPPTGKVAREFRGAAKAIVTIVGLALTVLTMIDGIGIIPPDAREVVAVMIAALTPIAVYAIPNNPKGNP